jgi:CDP-diacylglycerol--serine O-phosphatidyltransferase
LVSVDPARVLLAAALIYALSGPVQAVYRRFKGAKV